MSGAPGSGRKSERLEPWRDLFDPGTRDHLLTLVQEEFNLLQVGGAPSLHRTLARELVPLVQSYLAEHAGAGGRPHVEAARALMREVLGLCSRLESGRAPVVGREPEDWVKGLRACWQEFIAEGAAVHVYFIEPRRKQQAKEAAATKDEYRHRDTGELLTDEVLRMLFERRPAGQQKKVFYAEVKETYGMSEATARRWLRVAG